jgi:carboxypeptidase C (cathepsin A)
MAKKDEKEKTTDEEKKEEKKDQTPEEEKKKEEKPDVPPVETQHKITLAGKSLKYTVTTGMMPLKNAESGEKEAEIFFMAYTKDGVKDTAKRPVVFTFNGGPGSASVWLHLGAIGPKRVKMQDEGWMPPPPYKLVDNEHTWLDIADLVFIDPVGTGYSRAVKHEDNKKYWSLQSDLESVGEFIRLYLTRYQRWSSPLFLAGESYGTTRAAGLAGHLVNKGIAFNGIVLISTILNFQTHRFDRGNDLPYLMFVPTYAATAWYHNKLPKDLQKRKLRDVVAEVEAWVETDYTIALGKGDRLTEDERNEVIERLARYTGLESRYIDQTNLRVNIHRFCKELLRDQKRTVGRLDSRFKGRDAVAVTEFPEFDPSMVAIMPPYTATFNDYVRSELGYETDVQYNVLSFDVNQNWEFDRGKFADTSELLRSAMTKNPFMKILVGQGYYDLATPHFAAWYTLNHMDIDPELASNIQTADYEAGHMFYLDLKSLAKLKDDVAGFLKSAL